MKQRHLALVVFMVSFLLGVLLTLAAEKRFRKYPVKPEPVIQIDTVRDTVLIDSPVPKYIKVIDTVRLPVYVPVDGRVDTLYMGYPKEQKYYEDSTYTAWVSGVEPNLDSIRIFNNTIYKTITQTVTVPEHKKRDFVELDSQFLYDTSPYLPVTLNFGYSVGIFDVYAGGGYDLFQKTPAFRAGIRARIRF